MYVLLLPPGIKGLKLKKVTEYLNRQYINFFHFSCKNVGGYIKSFFEGYNYGTMSQQK